MDKKVDEYVAKQRSPQKEIINKLRRIILKQYPKIRERMRYGVPYYDEKYYLVALKDSVNLGFSMKGMSDKDLAFLDGGGKTMKHKKYSSLKEVDKDSVIKLLKLVKD